MAEPAARRGFARTAARVAAASAASMLVGCEPPARTPVPAERWLIKPTDPPFDIPADFLGLHSDHGLGGPTPAPDYPYDSVRSHDVSDGEGFPATQWSRIERAPGEYDWRGVERWIAAHPGKTRIWVLFGCPVFHQKYPGEPWPYPYLPGGGSPPKDPQAAARFIAALLARFPREFRFVELWNEPNMNFTGTDPNLDRWLPGAPKPPFFSGTAADLAAMGRAVRQVLPEAVRLIGCGWEGQSKGRSMKNSLLRFSAAPDGAGGRGMDHLQALSVHSYTYGNDPNKLIDELADYDSRFEKAGYPSTMPRYLTECGVESPGHWTETTPSIEQKALTIRRWCLITAAMRYSAIYLYKHSLVKTLGDPAANPALGKAITDMRNGLRNRRLRAAALLKDETVWLSFEDGTELRA